MPRKIHCTLIVFFALLFSDACFIRAQSVKEQQKERDFWSTTDPLKTDFFIENKGQFDSWVKSSLPVIYAINSSEKIFFTKNGLIFQVDTSVKVSNDRENNESMAEKGEEEPRFKTVSYFVKMEWLDCSKGAVLEAGAESGGYYTFGEKGYENIKARGYKTLSYKNLYSGIDVEYTIPDKGGIKYKIILHPGADVSKVKMKYSGDVMRTATDDEGNIAIKTPAGEIIDHAPQSYYEESGSVVLSAFKLKDQVVSFVIDLPESSDTQSRTIIIDPWTVIPNTLTTDNAAYDIDFDDFGNVFVSGGVYPFKLAKYSSSGGIIWTFTNPAGWDAIQNCYSKFCVLHNSGTTFIGEGFNYNPGPRIMKINSSGTLIYTSPSWLNSNEIWQMFYNRCTGQLIGFGGGIYGNDNLHEIADTNLTSDNVSNFNGYTGTCCNDITCAVMDYNGDFYALMSSDNGLPAVNNKLQKSLVSTGYAPPCAWDVASGYAFDECYNWSIPGFNVGSGVTVRSNVLALNSHYLFSYDGQTLKAWDKASGSVLGSVIVNAGYGNGAYRTHEGIAADECDNVYIAGTNTVHVYNFNSTSFTAGTPISAAIPAEVYDIDIDIATGTLYVCGLGFVVVTPANYCNMTNILNLTDSVNNCLGNACVTPNGGTPPYNYNWSNGATTSCINGVAPGMYIVTVTDNSCILQIGIDTIMINSSVALNLSNDTSICSGGTAVLTASGATTYGWSPSTGLSSTTGSTVNASPSATTVYTVTGTTGGCTGVDTVVVSVVSSFNAFLGNDTSLCGVPSYLLDAGYPGSTYLWSTGATSQTISVTSSGTYWVSVTNGTCSGADTIIITMNSSPSVNLGNDTSFCGLSSYVLDAGNPGSTYLWSTGATTQTITVSSSGVYWVSASNGVCSDVDTINLLFSSYPVVDLGNDTLICGVSSYMLDAGNPGSTYQWSTGGNTQTINVTSSGTYWVVVTNNGCSSSDTVDVMLNTLIVSLGNDTSYCGFDPVTLDAGNPGGTYQWSTGEVSQTISVSASGTYYVNVSNGLCTGADTITLAFVSIPVVNLGNDTVLCPGDILLLDAGNPGYAFTWSTGEHTQLITVDQEGTYSVLVYNGNCPGSDTIHVFVTPDIQLGRDVSLCDRDEYILSVNVAASSYLWSTGATTPSITVTEPGEYWVMAEYGKCELNDTIEVTGGHTSLYAPNAFTPDDDNLNETFLPLGEGITKYHLMVFTRWGQLIYETNDINAGWDGTFEGRLCQLGEYVWVIYYWTECTGERDLMKMGNVLLLR